MAPGVGDASATAVTAGIAVMRWEAVDPRMDARTITAETRAAIEVLPAARRHVPRLRNRMTSIVAVTSEKTKYPHASHAIVASALGQNASGICDPAAECNWPVVGRWWGNGQPTMVARSRGMPRRPRAMTNRAPRPSAISARMGRVLVDMADPLLAG